MKAIILTTKNLYTKEQAEAAAKEMNASDEDWSYVAVHDPEGKGWSFIEIYDEDGQKIGVM